MALIWAVLSGNGTGRTDCGMDRFIKVYHLTCTDIGAEDLC